MIYDGRFWIGECLDLQASFELNLKENPDEAGNLFISLNTWDNALKLMEKKHKYNLDVDYQIQQLIVKQSDLFSSSNKNFYE